MEKFRRAVVAEFSSVSGMPMDEASRLVAVPPDASMGDFAFPCFTLSKQYKKSPVEISVELQAKVKPGKLIEKAEAKGPYLNFFINQLALAEDAITAVLRQKEKYGSLQLRGKKALIEHTSINPNASPHVGRARNAIIGDSITRILRFHGYRTEVHYFVNDVGKQIAMLVLGCRDKKKLSFNGLLSEYIKINEQVEKDKSIEQEIFRLLNKLEAKDKKTVAGFKRVVKLCIGGQEKILSALGIKYDSFDYESSYLWSKETEKALELLKKTGKVFTDVEGRTVLDLAGFEIGMDSPALVLTRADSTSLYGLRDIAYNLDKASRAKDRNIVVLGEDHKLYFRQITSALSLMGIKAPEVVHYSFILLAAGKMSTRSGNVVLLEEFMRQAEEKALAEMASRKKKLTPAVKKLAKSIGYGAIKYHIVKVSPEKNVTFEWEQALSFEGESAPYIQYAHARICSILKKAKSKPAKADYSLLSTPEEQQLVKAISNFPDLAEKAAALLRPHIIANYAYHLADSFNRFYHACPVISKDRKLMAARLSLVIAAKQVLETSLQLLGIDAPKSM